MKEQVSIAWWVAEAIKDNKSKYLACTAGVGSGKSHGVHQILYAKMRKHPKAMRWFYAMPIYELIQNSVFPTAEKVYKSFGLIEEVHYRFVKTPYPQIRFCTGQIIDCISMHRPDKIKATEYAGGVIDEPGVTPDESIKRLIERTRSKDAAMNQIFLPGTPEGLENWFAEHFDSDRLPDWNTTINKDHTFLKIVENESKQKEKILYRRFRLSTYDNVHNLSADYIPSLLDSYGDDEQFVQAYIYGHFVPLFTGGCYKYKPRLHDIDDIEATPHEVIELTWDFNLMPVSWVAVQQRRFSEYGTDIKRRVVTHNAEFDNDSIAKACVEFAFKFPVEQYQYTPIEVWGDMSGHAGSHKTNLTDYQEIKRSLEEIGYKNIQVRALKHNPPQPAAVAALNKWFRDYEIVICKRCHKLKNSLLSTRWKKGQRQIDKPSGETHTHYSDALKYLAFAKQENSFKNFRSFNI